MVAGTYFKAECQSRVPCSVYIYRRTYFTSTWECFQTVSQSLSRVTVTRRIYDQLFGGGEGATLFKLYTDRISKSKERERARKRSGVKRTSLRVSLCSVRSFRHL